MMSSIRFVISYSMEGISYEQARKVWLVSVFFILLYSKRNNSFIEGYCVVDENVEPYNI